MTTICTFASRFIEKGPGAYHAIHVAIDTWIVMQPTHILINYSLANVHAYLSHMLLLPTCDFGMNLCN